MSAEQRADGSTSPGYASARRAYERGRLLASARHGLVLAALFAALGGLAVGRSACTWAVLVLATWVLVEWRGGALLAGARRGIVGGVVSLLLPWSILRPCCAPGADMTAASCCTMPGMCLVVGAALGLVLSAFLPRSAPGRRMETAAGMAIIMMSAASLKCSELFVGETVGLLGGLVAGVAAASLVRVALDRRLRTT